MQQNINSGYGQFFGRETNGKVFIVANPSEANYQNLQTLFKPDQEGVVRLYNDFTSALAATVSGRGDKIIVSQGYQAAPTLTELATAATKGVLFDQIGGKIGDTYVVNRAANTLPQTATGNLFSVTALVRVVDIVGEVTVATGATATNAKIRAVPTVGAAVDLSATAAVTSLAVGTTLNITGTLATALQVNASGVLPGQAVTILIPAGFISLNTDASDTGSIKWTVRYVPVYPGARVFAV